MVTLPEFFDDLRSANPGPLTEEGISVIQATRGKPGVVENFEKLLTGGAGYIPFGKASAGFLQAMRRISQDPSKYDAQMDLANHRVHLGSIGELNRSLDLVKFGDTWHIFLGSEDITPSGWKNLSNSISRMARTR